MKKKFFIEIIIYTIIPIIIWRILKLKIENYYAMLASIAPGIIYTVYKLYREKMVNAIGGFIFFSRLLFLSLALLKKSDLWFLQSYIWHQIILSFIFTVSLIIKKYIPFYFFIEMYEGFGYNREDISLLCHEDRIYKYFKYYTLFYIFTRLFNSAIRYVLISEFNVEGYDKILVITYFIIWILLSVEIKYVGYIMQKTKKIDR